jgi:hypothetical protein
MELTQSVAESKVTALGELASERRRVRREVPAVVPVKPTLFTSQTAATVKPLYDVQPHQPALLVPW